VRSDDAFVPVLLIRENNRNLAWSLFGQTEYDLAERWELTLGLRYDRDRRHHLGRAPVRTDRTEHFDDWQPRAVLSWRPSASTNAYASYARGFRSGGFNPPSVDSQRFDQETLDSFELGIKRDWLDRRLRTNLALFQARSRDYQTYYVDVSRAAQVLDNIDRVRMQGFELDLSARLGAGFSVALGVGVTDAEIRRYRARPQDQGNHAPRNQVLGTILGLEYLRRLPGGWAWQTLLEVDQRGRKYWHSVDRYSMPPFALLDARSRLDWQGGWIALWGRNLADEDYWQEYIAQEFAGLPGGDAGFRARGRTFGVDVGWTWD
jgi:iron complex outermembrane recepter protein